MNNLINISVVVPSKNRAHTLDRCIQSILSQTYLATEVIVVDDDSEDSTKDIVLKYANHGVTYVRLPEGCGAQAARNHGITIANHEWIAFQDSDDIWLPEKLAVQVETLAHHDFDKRVVVHGDGIRQDEKSGTEELIRVPLTTGDCYRQLLLQAGPMFQALLATRWAIIEAGGLDNDCPSYQEWDAAIRLSRICRFVHIRQPLFIWKWHAGETISKDFVRDLRGFDYVIRQHRGEIIAAHGHRAWRRLKIGNIARALSARQWDEAEAMMAEEPAHRSVSLARAFARRQFFPPKGRQFLYLMAT
jgi:glycosyltransferase involved in cell wall biosynthesis